VLRQGPSVQSRNWERHLDSSSCVPPVLPVGPSSQDIENCSARFNVPIASGDKYEPLALGGKDLDDVVPSPRICAGPRPGKDTSFERALYILGAAAMLLCGGSNSWCSRRRAFEVVRAAGGSSAGRGGRVCVVVEQTDHRVLAQVITTSRGTCQTRLPTLDIRWISGYRLDHCRPLLPPVRCVLVHARSLSIAGVTVEAAGSQPTLASFEPDPFPQSDRLIIHLPDLAIGKSSLTVRLNFTGSLYPRQSVSTRATIPMDLSRCRSL